MSVDNLHNTNGRLECAYAEMYMADNEIGQLVPTGNDYTQICPINASLGKIKKVTVNPLACNFVIQIKGLYSVSFTMSSKINVNQVTIRVVIFKNNIEMNNIHSKTVIKNATEENTGHIEGFINCEIGDVLDVRLRHDYANSVLVTNEYGNLNIKRIDI